MPDIPIYEAANGAGLEAIGAVKSAIGIVKTIDSSGVERVLQAGEKVYPNETIATSEGGLVLVDSSEGNLKQTREFMLENS